jgi:dihydrolipoamide dehydrogenase
MAKNDIKPLVVFGGGPGGYAAAFAAADLGLDVTLVDIEENPGGTCLYRGCIPSKALLHAAKVMTEAREAKQWGITFPEPEVDIDKLREKTYAVVGGLTDGLGQLCKARKINYVRGRARFDDSNRLVITRPNGEEEVMRFEKCILATGSRPAMLEHLMLDSPRVMNSTDALEIQDIPATMLVIGGGYIGLELGSVYAALGTKVTIVEMTPGLLPGADADLIKPLADRVKKIMHKILLKTKVDSMKEVKNGIEVKMSSEGLEQPALVFEKVLICIGRRPNSSGIGLQSTGVEVDDKGFVKVDAQRRTTDPNIFAVGDLTGQPMLAHKASHEGRVAAEVIAGQNSAFEPRAIPAVVFTDPELAWCGITENEAKAQGRDVKIAKFPWGASGRAATMGRPEGVTKIIADPETDEVLGVGICGSGAGELISEGALAIEMGALASDIQFTIHPHPTLGETIMETAEIIFGSSTHSYRGKRS